MAVLPNITAENEALKAQIAELQAKLASKSKVSFKVTEKGGVSVYGLGRFPVTLYGSQWNSLLAKADELKAFLQANESKLATKPV